MPLLALEPPRTELSTALVVDDPADLIQIRRPDVNLCIWQRAVDDDVSRYSDTLLVQAPCKRTSVSTRLPPDPTELLTGLPRAPGFSAFAEDLLGLARLCAQVSGGQRFELKLTAFAGNLCERFHVDSVPLRLLCTYAGPGTEWLADADAHREALRPSAEPQTNLIRPGGWVRQLERFSVALLKGELWPGNRGRGAIHRSPAGIGGEVRRVLFKMDVLLDRP